MTSDKSSLSMMFGNSINKMKLAPDESGMFELRQKQKTNFGMNLRCFYCNSVSKAGQKQENAGAGVPLFESIFWRSRR
jgi:hypothetical protein